MNARHRYLTISVDDGHPTDFKAADLFDRFGLKATFYIPARNPEREVMSSEKVRELSECYEIGAHTLSHLSLKSMNRERAWEEIEGSKKWVEDTTGKECPSFCYPQGKFTAQTAKLVEQAGFLGARTCMFNLNAWPEDPYRWGVSTHAYSHSRAVQVRHALLEGNFAGVGNFFRVHRGAVDWQTHFLRSVDWVEENGGIAHLYFHSWEIEEQGQWDKLKSLLAQLSKREGLTRVTNGELFTKFAGSKTI